MTPRGGRRKGAGRPLRTEPKSRPIWCGQMSEQDRAQLDRFARKVRADERRRIAEMCHYRAEDHEYKAGFSCTLPSIAQLVLSDEERAEYRSMAREARAIAIKLEALT